ncbi:MAG TPA: RsmB/NOP family class I SAM-dependent RNA methyltransferase [Leptolyngbyaceae cyanobacterium M65_K2018_010]|nr:RsmB/NOP family class I SAM-dependent RNA methyltransferase [Leptolyngbyaceae cyanobacterium M65_K2018_010]
MGQPSPLLVKLSRQLFSDAPNQAAFVAALTTPPVYPPALVWTQPRPHPVPFTVEGALPWQPLCVDRVAPGQRPGQHSLHQQGFYYCLDTASVFLAAVLGAIPRPVDWVLDLCAAPGGKSLLAWQMLQPSQLWCNETIRKRVKILIANLKRCGATHSQVFNLDPQVFADHIPQAVPVVIVDAPCSGQSLLAKGEPALGCFHPVTLRKNVSRQRRILAQAAQVVAGGGYLAYMTCTFSPAENEQMVSWLLKQFPQFEAVEVPLLQDYASALATFPCYRLWPQSGLGAGGFTVLLRSRSETVRQSSAAFVATYGQGIYGERPEA